MDCMTGKIEPCDPTDHDTAMGRLSAAETNLQALPIVAQNSMKGQLATYKAASCTHAACEACLCTTHNKPRHQCVH